MPNTNKLLTEEDEENRNYLGRFTKTVHDRYHGNSFNWYTKSTIQVQRLRCERNLIKVFNSPIIKLMANALRSEGCPVDLSRHFVCDDCSDKIMGGYDPVYNQVIICQNMCRGKGRTVTVLFHEMIHMFDNCTKEFDYSNIDHVACTEIRAAHITGCPFISQKIESSKFDLKVRKQHKECVKSRAIRSILMVKDVNEAEATASVERVFDRCYNDLEPVGRRIKFVSDMKEAYEENCYKRMFIK